jgi:hypothetical protein
MHPQHMDAPDGRPGTDRIRAFLSFVHRRIQNRPDKGFSRVAEHHRDPE